jgi:hypothetical protein
MLWMLFIITFVLNCHFDSSWLGNLLLWHVFLSRFLDSALIRPQLFISKLLLCHPSTFLLFNKIFSYTNSLSPIQLGATLLLSLLYIYRPDFQRVVRRCTVGGGNDMVQFHLHATKCYRKRGACEHNVLVFASGIFKHKIGGSFLYSASGMIGRNKCPPFATSWTE